MSLIVNATPVTVERVKYSAYGVPSGCKAGDYDSDMDFDATDATAISGGSYLVLGDSNLDGATGLTDSSTNTNRWNNGTTTYDVLPDYDLNGSIQPADVAAFVNDWNNFPNGGRGQLSRSDTGSGASNCDNRIGYAGYQWDPIIKKYLARNRWEDPELGTWFRRDPLGYHDGMGLHEYVKSAPHRWSDPDGLIAMAGGGCAGCSQPGGAAPMTPFPTWPFSWPLCPSIGCQMQSMSLEACKEICDHNGGDIDGGTQHDPITGCPTKCCICDINIGKRVRHRGVTPEFPSVPGVTGPVEKAIAIIRNCVWFHETIHLTQRIPPMSQACAECEAYMAEYACLGFSLGACNGDKTCERIVKDRQLVIKCKGAEWCAACRGIPYEPTPDCKDVGDYEAPGIPSTLR